jgi:uncharacterized protein (TIGR04255 family)
MMRQKMTHAPVYFTFAQVRHNTILRLDAHVPEIQERMRQAGYPDYRTSQALVLNVTTEKGADGVDIQRATPQPVARHMFASMDGTHAFSIEPGAFAFQTTEYDTFGTFEAQCFTGLRIVHECIKLDYFERIGIRYLDVVVPGTGEPLQRYLAPGVIGLAGMLPEGVSIGLSLSETHIPLPDADLISRVIVRTGPLGFPMDLEPQGLRVPERFQQVNGVHAIIDTDAFQSERHAFDLEQIRQRLDMLHKKVWMAFEATTTPDALKAWQ